MLPGRTCMSPYAAGRTTYSLRRCSLADRTIRGRGLEARRGIAFLLPAPPGRQSAPAPLANNLEKAAGQCRRAKRAREPAGQPASANKPEEPGASAALP